MAKANPVDSDYVWSSLLHHPVDTAAALFAQLKAHGYFDISVLWRQFYDSTGPQTIFMWYTLLTYAAVCVGFAAYQHFRAGGKRPGIASALLPGETWKYRSFRHDLKWQLLLLFRVGQIALRVILLMLFVSALTRAFVWLGAYDVPILHHIRATLASLPLLWSNVLQFLIAILAAEFGYYWGHRLCHQSKYLWQFHKVHHYSQQLTPLASARNHPVDQAVASVLTLAALGLTMSLFFAYQGQQGFEAYPAPFAVYALYRAVRFLDLFYHSHIPLSYGPILDRIFVSPRLHQMHHSRDIPDKNFCEVLSVWDVMFGTWYRPAAGETVRFGISEFGDDHYRGVLHMLGEPFVTVCEMARASWRGTP